MSVQPVPHWRPYYEKFKAIQKRLKGADTDVAGPGGTGGTRKNISTRIEQLNQVFDEFVKMKRPASEKTDESATGG